MPFAVQETGKTQDAPGELPVMPLLSPYIAPTFPLLSFGEVGQKVQSRKNPLQSYTNNLEFPNILQRKITLFTKMRKKYACYELIFIIYLQNLFYFCKFARFLTNGQLITDN